MFRLLPFLVVVRGLSDTEASYLSASKHFDDLDLDSAYSESLNCSETHHGCAALAAKIEFLVDRESGFSNLKDLADAGNPDAQYIVGILHSATLNISPHPGDSSNTMDSHALGILYLYAASTGGHDAALSALGFRHSLGLGVPRRCDTSALNYVEVAKKTAQIYSSGLPQALELIRLSIPGMTGSEDYHITTTSSSSSSSRDGRLSSAEIALFQKLALTDASIAHNVAKRYLLGYEGFKQDYSQAWKFLDLHRDKHAPSISLKGYMKILGIAPMIGSSGGSTFLNERAVQTITSQVEEQVQHITEEQPRHIRDPVGQSVGHAGSLQTGEVVGKKDSRHESHSKIPPSHKEAENLFLRALEISSSTDALALNGLGFLRFQEGDMHSAFRLFNESASRGSADGMFNTASMYLTGIPKTANDDGIAAHFQRAFLWYSQALEIGHTPAGYALGLMHLNGIGTSRDCKTGVQLLKETTERSVWVAKSLQRGYNSLNIHSASWLFGSGYTSSDSTVDTSRLIPKRFQHLSLTTKQMAMRISVMSFLEIAEAGQEVAQQNLAYLLEEYRHDAAYIFLREGTVQGSTKTSRGSSSSSVQYIDALAQRYYELSASQVGSAGWQMSLLKLGDFAFKGKAVKSEIANGQVVLKFRTAPDYLEAFKHYDKAFKGSGHAFEVLQPSEDKQHLLVAPPGASAQSIAAFSLGYLEEWCLVPEKRGSSESRDKLVTLDSALIWYERAFSQHSPWLYRVFSVWIGARKKWALWTPGRSQSVSVRLYHDLRFKVLVTLLMTVFTLLFLRRRIR